MSDKKLTQVRALLAKAESTTHPAEAESLRAKAMELIVKYGINEAMLAAHHGWDSSKVDRRELLMEAPFAAEKVALYTAVSYEMGIRTVQCKRWASGYPFRFDRSDRRVTVLDVFGRSGDLDAAEILYTSLLLQQATEFSRVDCYSYSANGMDKAAYRRSWLVAYATRIFQRMEAEYHRQTQATTGAALVLVDRAKATEDAIAEAYTDLRTPKPRKLSGAGWEGGFDAANRADLGGGDDRIQTSATKELG